MFRWILLLCFVIQSSAYLFAQPVSARYNLRLLSKWDDDSLPALTDGQVWNDLTGWKDTIKKREYIIAGTTDSIYFFDITNPNIIIKCDVESGRSKYAVNRDYETYSHYAYCVSDKSSGPTGSLQIFDLQYLPDSVHKVYDSDEYSIYTHTCFIEPERKRLYLSGNTYRPGLPRAMGIFSLDKPDSPAFLGEIASSTPCKYVHEVYVRKDTAYCACGNNGLYIYDVRNPAFPFLIGTITAYPFNGYCHSAWLDSTGNYLLVEDEVPTGLPMKIFDVRDKAQAKYVTSFQSNPKATAHNGYWKGRYGYVSTYEDGVYVYDLGLGSNDSMPFDYKPKVIGMYDTYPYNPVGTYWGFYGCWGVYPFLPSGNIIASDMQGGIMVFNFEYALGIEKRQLTKNDVRVMPNPFSDAVAVHIANQESAKKITLDLYSIDGRKCLSEQFLDGRKPELNTSALPAGMYYLHIATDDENTVVLKMVKN
jgi:choice-of-anchor B domain-containing protein